MDETPQLIGEAGGVFAKASPAMSRSSGSIEAMVARCIERFGRLDVLVNNVGGSARGGPVEMSEDVWDAQVDHNLKSVFLTCKHVLPHMVAGGGGAIVNVSSTSGLRWTGAAQIAYAATKAGVMQFSRVLAVQYAPQGVRVNTVVPGPACTRRWSKTRLAGQRAGGDVEALAEATSVAHPHAHSWATAATPPRRRFSSPRDEARFITGTEIVVDGGMSVRCD
jgi:NAD(P)-dependent dehydrogenase (short-subunit alcohol dehydrogenase family)